MKKEEQAKQFYIFWHRMLGYPGISNAYNLIRKFTNYKKFEWGKYKGRFVADIIMIDRQYIQWCIDKIPCFMDKLSIEEKSLFLAGENGYHIGGETTEIIGNACYSFEREGDMYDYTFINEEIEKLKEEE